jgi:hypothetical protein
VQRVAIELGVRGDGGDAHLATGAHDAHGDLAAVGDEDFLQLANLRTRTVILSTGCLSVSSVMSQIAALFEQPKDKIHLKVRALPIN